MNQNKLIDRASAYFTYRLALLLITFIFSISTTAQGSATVEITQPGADGACTGAITLVEFHDCGIPGASAWIKALSDLPLGEEQTGFCPGTVKLMISDTSWYASEHYIRLSADSASGRFKYDFECFDSTYYSPDIDLVIIIYDPETDAAIPGARLVVTDEQGRTTPYVQQNFRGLDVILPTEQQYLMTFEAEGYVSKMLEVDGRVSDPWAVGAGFEMNIELDLLEYKEGVDLEVLSHPMSEATFDAASRRFVWDMERLEKYDALVDSIYRR